MDVSLRALSQAANKGRLWIALAAAATTIPGPTRRAAIRGIGSLAVTSAIANAALKPVFRRRRPDIDRTPVIRRLTRQPQTTSFPSGHAASAAAFATGVALESRVLGAAVAPLAAAVGYSRVHVGVHHAADVVAGAALGAGVALAGQWWWPARRTTPLRQRAQRHVPALPEGDGLVVVVNRRAGDGDDPTAGIVKLLPRAEIIDIGDATDVAAELSARARPARAMGVAGGDGTVASAAATAMAFDLPLAVFPSGTLNHFARDVGLNTHADTAAAVEAGTGTTVDVATANGIAYLNTASIGGYPEMVQHRERLVPQWGTWMAMVIGAARVLRSQEPLHLELDGVATDVWSLFVGNCCYTPRGAFPAWRPRLDDGVLDVQYLSARQVLAHPGRPGHPRRHHGAQRRPP